MMYEGALDLQSLKAAYAKGAQPQDVVAAVFARIAAVNDPGIFITLKDKAAVLAEAQALGAYDPLTKPLYGVPFAVKDNIDVAGLPTTAACPDFAYTPAQDATVVALLKQAGALVIGKTNLDQFATGLVGVRTPYPVPKNALDARLVPGGSSSGSAVATAHGLVSFALGTDTAGSGRIPAGLNNIVGLKPSLGALSTTGVVPACRTLDCVSIFALTVDDAYAVLQIAAKLDAQDAYSRPLKTPALTAPPPVLKIGVPAKADRAFFGDAAMAAGFDKVLADLQTLGATLVEIPFADFYSVANLLYDGAWVAERLAAIEPFYTAHEASLHPVTHKIIGGARALTATDAFRGFYRLQALKTKLAPLIASVDMLCVPTAPTHYTVDEVLADPILTNSRLGTYTNFVNFLGLCGIAVPCGKRSDGLPMSVMLLARDGQDALTASFACKLQSFYAEAGAQKLGATAWSLPPHTPMPPALQTDAIELAVVGAHLSGMALNHQLQALEATFLRAVQTTPDYALYALAGEAIPKPGLLRVADGQGTAIAVEVWQLSPDAFGKFVAQIPPPLGIGTLRLADGTTPKGFLVEPEGLRGAVDISHFGGWRAYVAGRG